MKIWYAPKFVRMLKRIPQTAQRLFFKQEKILKTDWRDPRLHLKQMRGTPISFSFRITRSYRAFFYFRASDQITLYAIGHRKDIYRSIR